MRMKYNLDTKLLFQIGDPLDHATAAYIHNAMYELAHVNAINQYAIVKKGELPKFIECCKYLGVVGFDIATPHKTDIIQYLDECDEFSREFQSVNHVKIREGKLIGIGLDGAGMAISLEQAGAKFDGRALILGAGAVTGPIAAEICKKGTKEMVILNRTVAKAESIAEILRRHFDIPVISDTMTTENIQKYAENMDIVVNCTSLGIASGTDDYSDEDLAFIEKLPAHCTVADVVYNPVTKLQKAAMARGLKVVGGMPMMFNQERALMKFHFDIDLPEGYEIEGEEAMRTAVTLNHFWRKQHGYTNAND